MASAAYESVPVSETGKGSGGSTLFRIGCCCCGCLFCALPVLGAALYYGLAYVLKDVAMKNFLLLNDFEDDMGCGDDLGLNMANITLNMIYPKCDLLNGSWDECLIGEDACFKKETLLAMDGFNKKFGGSIVSYKSRPGKDHAGEEIEQLTLRGWWLPAPEHNQTTPRIVIQHGFTSCSNKFRQQLLAWELRQMGFSVLVNNLRDHCYSDDSKKHIYYEWGHAYPFDLLGAWDYAVKDPDNIMGGELPSEKVGVMGFSKGAFLSLIALGIESKIPGAWADSPPFNVLDAILGGGEDFLTKKGAGFIAPLLVPIIRGPVWNHIQSEARKQGIDLNDNLPEKALPMGPDTKRPVKIVGNKVDTKVPIFNAYKMTDLIEKYPEKYTLSTWITTGLCNGANHVNDHLRVKDEYMQNLCAFWTDVFGIPYSSCGLDVVLAPEEIERRLLDQWSLNLLV